MAEMVRKQVYLTREQNRALEQAARRQRRSEAEIIREALDHHLGDEAVPPIENDSLWEIVGNVTEGPPDVSESIDRHVYGKRRRP